jgi:spermidine/putrescine transport system permease protein
MIKSRYPAFPYIAFMAIFIIVPLIMVAYFAFTTSTGEFTVQNIIRVGDYVPVIVKSPAERSADGGIDSTLLL